MSMTFTKLFSSITESTIWAEPANTRIVWITMLAMADRCGRVWASIPGLANRARVPLEDCETALETFLSPDKYSRTADNEGRRIEPIDGGWKLLNHAKYRAIRDEEAIRESKRKHINTRRAIERSVDNVERGRTRESTVDRGRHNAEAEADAEAENSTAPLPGSASPVEQDANRLIADHPHLSVADFGPKRKGVLVKLIEAVGYEKAKGYIDQAVTAKAASPVDYAMGIYRSELRDGKHDKPPPRKQEKLGANFYACNG